MKILTKEQFRDAVDSGKFEIRPTNIVIVNGNTYSLKVYEHEDKVEMDKIEEFE